MKIKETYLVLAVTMFFVLLLNAQVKAHRDNQRTAIKNTALDYVEGWYSGNDERMERALYKDLAKRGLVTDEDTQKSVLQPVTTARMIELTRQGVGKRSKDRWGIKVTIQDIYKNIASVKIVSSDYVDYVHVAKVDGEWKIANVLWEARDK